MESSYQPRSVVSDTMASINEHTITAPRAQAGRGPFEPHFVDCAAATQSYRLEKNIGFCAFLNGLPLRFTPETLHCTLRRYMYPQKRV